MKYGIRAASVIAALALAAPTYAQSDAFNEILRAAALKNGLRPAAQLFNDTDENLGATGKHFFNSKNISLNGNISCQTCHLDQFASADGIPNAVGIFGEGEGPDRARTNGRIVPRNALPFWGRGAKNFETFFWDGKVDFADGKRISQFGEAFPSDDPLVTAVHLPPLELGEMLNEDDIVNLHKRETPGSAKSLHAATASRLTKVEPAAAQELASKLSKDVDELTFLDIARSVAAFIRSEFRLKDTKLHRFVFGSGTLSDDELRGGLIFYGKGKCVTCHYGPHFSDFKFHAVPLPQLGFGKNGFGVDYGRFNVTFAPEDLYRFRTPPLFNVERTAPYGHAGSLRTLTEAIIAHFDPLRVVDVKSMDNFARHEFFRRMAAAGDALVVLTYLDDREVSQVEAFLKTLTFE